MANNSSKSLLMPAIRRFFTSITKNKEVNDLAANIQKNLELGHTAINYVEYIEDKTISCDGCHGYIVQANGLAGFRRFYNMELAIAENFTHSRSIKLDNKKVKLAIENVLNLTNQSIPEVLDQQWQACLSSLNTTRFILSGGPGTGKTTTVFRLMLLAMNLNPDVRIALSAPTGKAANRMMQSINSMLEQLNLDEASLNKLSQPATTIHRLLGYNHETNTLKYNIDNPLPNDLVIIDESSMLDVSMAYALLKALKPQAQLVLIGDKNQLPAVDAGNVFSDLCHISAQDKSEDLISYYVNNNSQKPLVSNYIELNKNYRFESGSVVAELCKNILSKDIVSLETLKQDKNFNWQSPNNKEEKTKLLSYWLENIPANESSKLLSPVNFGSNSVSELNELVKKLKYNSVKLHQGMPIMVTKNDYTLGVFNGDIGLLKKVNDIWVVPFMIEGKEVQINLDSINGWTDASAISIHKSQGSEYDHVLIALPDDLDLELLSNSLLYTAISRAKKSIFIWSNKAILHKTINANSERTTFLKKYKIIQKKS